MQNQIPLPTDNIFKFYALFGLLLFVFSIGSVLYVSSSTNNLIYEAVIDLGVVKSIEKDTPANSAKRTVLERKIEVATDNRKFFILALGLIAGTAFWLMFYGFWKWHREIQPAQDEIAKLQRDKINMEVALLKMEVASFTSTVKGASPTEQACERNIPADEHPQ